MSWFDKVKQSLTKSSSKINESINSLFIKKKLDQETLDELEELLIMSDLGIKTSQAIIKQLAKNKFEKEITTEEIKQELASVISDIIKPNEDTISLNNKPTIMLICGVNGSGKTTAIGKLASHFMQKDLKVLIAACDTFRAAAVEQITEWSKRNNCPIVTGESQADPASVAFKAVEQAYAENYDILLIDTAGRLHNKDNLMAELAKIDRVIKKIDDQAPHHKILVLDSTTGQNAKIQLEKFNELININGLIFTKLDGTAKAGALVGIANETKLPIYFIGIGEKITDLVPFEAEVFAKNLFS